MTATTTEKAHPLDALADTLDQIDNDRDRSQFLNRLNRLANSERLADVLAAAAEQHDGPAVIVALNRGPERDDLPAVVTVPWTLNRAGDTLALSLFVDPRDTVRGIVATDDHAAAVMFGENLPRLAAGKGSTSTTARRLADGIPTGDVLKVTQHATDKNGRNKYVVTVAEESSGTRGRSAAACI